MGFGGGDFGGGGSSDFGGSSWDRDDYYSDRYSDSSSGDCDSEYNSTLIKTIVLIFFAIPLIVFTLVLLSADFTSPVYCANGTSLNPGEQMWCKPSEETTVTAYPGERVDVFRFKLKDAPPMIEREVTVDQDVSIHSNGYQYYSFVMNPGSTVSAHLTTPSSYVDCYLLDNYNEYLYVNGYSFNSILSSKPPFQFDSYSPNK